MSEVDVSTSLADVVPGNAATVAGTPSDSSVSPTALLSTESASYIEIASSGDPDKVVDSSEVVMLPITSSTV